MPDIEISIKGREGSGKTTMLRLVSKFLKDIGMNVILIDGYSPPQLIPEISEEEMANLKPKKVEITTMNTQGNKELSESSVIYPNI